jgi:hypothetical protein
MRLDVLQPNAFVSRDGGQRAHLVGNKRENRIGRQVKVPAAEPFAIRKSGVSADGNAICPSETNRLAHDGRISRMSAAGDVRGRDATHQQLILSGELANISVQIDPHALRSDTLVILPT